MIILSCIMVTRVADRCMVTVLIVIVIVSAYLIDPC